MPQLVVLRAAPATRGVCPPGYIEGEWREIPDHVHQIEISTPDGARELVCEPSGKWERRDDDGTTAPVWEVRYA